MKKILEWRYLALLGYIILFLGMLAALAGIEHIQREQARFQHSQIQQLRDQCIDRRGQLATRHYFERVRQLTEDVASGKITTEQARKAFIDSYTLALQEAGPPPPCLVK